MNVRRGDIWLVDFGEPIGHEQSGRRPAVIVSADLLNESPAGIVIAVPTTTAVRGLPSQIELDPDHTGLDHLCYAKCEDVKSISAQRLITRLGHAEPEAIFQISRALGFLLEL